MQPKPKFPFDIKLETFLPATLTYRVFAENEQDALKELKGKHPTNIKYNIQQKRDIKATVYAAGTTLIKFIKNFHR